MKGLFCYDGPLKADKDGDYYGIALNNNIFSRYYVIASHLSVAINTKYMDEKLNRNKYSRIELDNFDVIPIPRILSVKGFLIKRRMIRKQLYEEISKADFVIARLPSLIGYESVEISEKIGKPVLVEIVGCPWESFWNHSFLGKIIAPYMYIRLKKISVRAKYVIYVTNNFLQNRYPTKGTSTNCSNVVLNRFDEKNIDKRLSKITSMNKLGKVIIGTTGAVNVRYKGQQHVIKALSELKKEGITKYEYQMVGGGDSSYLRQIARKYDVLDQVKFIGALSHENVFEWLDSIDIYVQPSETEGLPRGLIEAMSRGCPSIGSDAGGIPELLEEECVFSKSNHKKLAEIIFAHGFSEEWLKSKAKRNFIEAKNYEKDKIEKRRNKFLKDFRDQEIN